MPRSQKITPIKGERYPEVKKLKFQEAAQRRLAKLNTPIKPVGRRGNSGVND